MRILDLFCAAGGAATGYARAGFDVVGSDIDPQPAYGYPFHQADALTILRNLLDNGATRFDRGTEHYTFGLEAFDAIHASPPCQGYSTITPDHRRGEWPRLIAPIRELLTETGLPYVIENVEGARRELVDPIRLCGSSFGLRVRRHRWFESNVWLTGLPCRHAEQGDPIGIYGDHWDSKEFLRPDGTRRGAKATSLEQAREAMGMPWVTEWHDLVEAIPPVMSDWIGGQLATYVKETAA